MKRAKAHKKAEAHLSPADQVETSALTLVLQIVEDLLMFITGMASHAESTFPKVK